MYKTIPPSEALRNYVECFWFGNINLGENRSFTHYSVATGKAELLFHYVGDYLTADSTGRLEKIYPANFYGQTNLHRQYTTFSKTSEIFGVRFYPHAVPILFSVPAADVSGKTIQITDLLGKDAAELNDKVFSSAGSIERLKILTEYLEEKVKRIKRQYRQIEYAVEQLYISDGQINQSELINRIGLSQRQFERNFKELVGFAPKFYSKIVRFESAIESYRHSKHQSKDQTTNQRKKTLTDLAIDCGYFDQAHFIRDFKQFSGVTPATYFNRISGFQ